MMAPAIFDAIRKNDEAAFNQLTQDNQQSVMEDRDEENLGESVLHLVTKLGHQEFAKKIIGICPSLVRSTNDNGDTPLHVAATWGRKKIMVQMLEFGVKSTPLDNASEGENLEITMNPPEAGLKLAELVNNDGLTPLHCAAISGSVKILKVFSHKTPSSFDVLTLLQKETVFHLAVRHKNLKAFELMAQKVFLEKLLYQPDKDGNTVLHTAASVGSAAIAKYITNETKIDTKAKNMLGLAAVDLLDKDDANFPSMALKFGGKSYKEENVMHSEALLNARNTITVVAILIASITFASGMNPPGGVYQEGDSKGKAIAAKTVAFKVFSVSNSIALFTSVSIVILLVSIIPYKMISLKKFLVITHKMMSISVAAMATSYVAAGWVILPHFEGTKWLLYTTLAISTVMLGGMYVYLWFKLAKHILRKMDTDRTSDEEAATGKDYYMYWRS